MAPLALLALVALVAACGGSAATNGPAAQELSGKPVPAAATAGSAAGAAVGGTTDGNTSDAKNTLYDINQASLLIIKTGTLDLQVAAIDDALAAASTKIASLGGYASGSQRSGDGEAAAAQVTYRIPAPRWDDALVGLRGIATKVLSEQSQTDDVTGQVVDLGARITNLQATEAALQAIMAKAEKIADVLAVQAQLTDVRGQIEQATAEKSHLQQQAAYSTLTVSYTLKEVAVETATKQFDPNHEVDQASASLVGVLQGLATAGIWFGIVWLPILLAVGIVASVVLFLVRRIRRVGAAGGPPVTPDAGAEVSAGAA